MASFLITVGTTVKCDADLAAELLLVTLSLLLTMLLLTLAEVTCPGTAEVLGRPRFNAVEHQSATTLKTASACIDFACCAVMPYRSRRTAGGGVNYMMRGR